MNMRDILDIISEARSYELQVIIGYRNHKTETRVYENPSLRDVIDLCKKNPAWDRDANLRGFTYKNVVYVWPAHEATHAAVQVALGFEEVGQSVFLKSPDVVNFQVRGRGWQEGEYSGNKIITQDDDDAEKLEPLARRWGCRFDGGYY